MSSPTRSRSSSLSMSADGVGQTAQSTVSQRNNAATRIQSVFRGNVARRQAAEHIVRTDAASNAGVVMERSRVGRNAELTAMRNSGAVADRTFDLMRTRFTSSDPTLLPMFSAETPSTSHNVRTMSVANDLLGRMFRNANLRGRNQDPPVTPNASGPRGHSATLNVEYDPSRSPHYNQGNNTISLMNRGHLDEAAHELQHAHDHIRGVLDLHQPTHRLASELLAFAQQSQVSHELTRRPPANFDGRDPFQMAQSYEGKVQKGYQGTLKSSIEAVQTWSLGRKK